VNKTHKLAAAATLALGLALAGCSSAAETTSENLSKAADNFEIERTIVFFNGITGQAMLTIEGRCSLNDQGTQLEVTCKIGEEAYFKHFLGKGDNTFYIAEQVEAANVDPFHHRIVIRPEALVPEFDLQTSGG
jgi:hypothetical protein